MCYLLVIHIFLYEAQGIRLRKSIVVARNHQEIITESLSSNPDVESAMVTEPSSGTILKKRRLSSYGHWLPKIHEDYHGPRHDHLFTLPRHH
ncbi:hypothetical protein HanHA89_Chr03g0088291 [Helianthus annuus]|nr:hypothetical protein HanHA89_Chr03g0088291 [Helianthus annuus]